MKIKNPIQRGFYPDPSICRAGNEYFMVHSTFVYAPGIPVFKSSNLRDWVQIGHVLERKEQLCLEGSKVSEGIYAPAIRYFEGEFYVIVTNVSGGGNFYVTAKYPEGPWSDPVFLKDAPGIDPSLFFENGKCYYIGQKAKEHAAYYGDCEIWIQELDLKEKRLVKEPESIFDGSMKHTIWAEGPHLYHKGDYYYLLLAEGGTEYNHSVTIARSRFLYGPYESCPHNPILTHRHLGHTYPIQNAGHGDLIETSDGQWFMVMLATRPLNGCAELGRETFLAEVVWEEDWPVVNPRIGRLLDTQEILAFHEENEIVSINKRDIKWTLPLDMRCLGLRGNPSSIPLKLEEGKLYLPFRPGTMEDLNVPAYIGTRLLSRTFDIEVTLETEPEGKEEAGLLYFYDESHYIKIVIQNIGSSYEAVVIKRTSKGETEEGRKGVTGKIHKLHLQGKNQMLFAEADHNCLTASLDLKELCSEKAGGFTGCTIGIYASSKHEKSDLSNTAVFETLHLDFQN